MICRACKKGIPDESVFCMFCGKMQLKAPRKKSAHANGEGYVFKRGGKWAGRVSDMARTSVDPMTGRVHRAYVQKGGFKTEAAARAWCIGWYGGLKEQRPAPTLGSYWSLFSSGEMEKLSDSKRTAYKIAWKKCETLAGMPVDRITVADLRRAVADHAPSYYTARDMRVLLSHLFKLAGADRFADADLPSFIPLPKLQEKTREPFTREEQVKMWAAFDAGDMAAAWPLLMIYTGMMPGETIGLTIPMINYDSLTISGAGLKTEVRKNSVIYLPPILVPVLQAVQGDRTDGKLFRWNRNKLYNDYHEFTARIGVRDLDPYSCRHTAATALAVDMEVAPETLRKIMRWSKTSNMAARYVHPTDHDAAVAVAMFSRPEKENE